MSIGRAAEPLLRSPANEVQPRLSPNGRWLAYASDETGTWEVYARGIDETQGKWQLSRGGGTQPFWRGDSRELYYVGLDGVLNVVSITGDRTLQAATPQPLFQTTLPNALAPFRTSYAVSQDGQRFLLNCAPSELPECGHHDRAERRAAVTRVGSVRQLSCPPLGGPALDAVMRLQR